MRSQQSDPFPLKKTLPPIMLDAMLAQQRLQSPTCFTEHGFLLASLSSITRHGQKTPIWRTPKTASQRAPPIDVEEHERLADALELELHLGRERGGDQAASVAPELHRSASARARKVHEDRVRLRVDHSSAVGALSQASCSSTTTHTRARSRWWLQS
jgi:hypothetical protein